MTRGEIADVKNLRTAFRKVAANRVALGPDRQTIDDGAEALRCMPGGVAPEPARRKLPSRRHSARVDTEGKLHDKATRGIRLSAR